MTSCRRCHKFTIINHSFKQKRAPVQGETPELASGPGPSPGPERNGPSFHREGPSQRPRNRNPVVCLSQGLCSRQLLMGTGL